MYAHMPRERPLILVADDDEQVRRLIRVSLLNAGYDVETAEDGLAALAAIERLRPDLVILDMVLPQLNGWGVLRRLGAASDAPPVIAVSGEYQPASALKGAVSCVRGYAIKPLQMRSLVQTCAQILGAAAQSTDPAGRERRCETRYPVESSVTILGIDRSALAVGRTHDLSRGGLCIRLGIGLLHDQPVRLHLELPGSVRPLFVRGVARWSQDGKVGVAFRDVEPPVRVTLGDFLATQPAASDRPKGATPDGAAAPGPETAGDEGAPQ
jgi:CheY-like chemotaxis protein